MEIIKYEGKSNYIIVLFKQDDKLYVLYARTGDMSLNNQAEDCGVFDGYENSRITSFTVLHNFTISIPLLQRENKTFSIIHVDNEKAYNLIKTVVEDLL